MSEGRLRPLTIWLQEANCFSPGTFSSTYAAANQAAAGLAAGQCGLTDGSSIGDWRLPTKAEWEATVARGVTLNCRGMTNDQGDGCSSGGPTSFTGVLVSDYWSSTTRESRGNTPWYVDLNGVFNSSFKTVDSHAVWPVRGGQR